ncbi:TonB-dependent receptor [Pseudomaricurvus sp. HS19]|uniref:TonB-dependent receptor n=1 Tax=Pseudomaricurvus sp. HS19 TaxID=2692626 RepID=UPI00136C959F|nr:TonB-dependent receptor [Pseudomaricurvus sp. HS19]MYM64276.1 TonB-dependent receptor [Pseudomaricurvus sp. HS19]
MKANKPMMRGAAALALAFPMSIPVLAQESSGFMLEEVVVTARRKDESLQDVPQTVNAVGSDTFEKLNILNFQDMQSVVPGVSLDSGSNGFSTQATMRGVDFSIESGVAPSVEFYLNDAPVESNQIFTQVFDVGQVEVLRGPQGTLRGRSAPSGAITVRSRAANFDSLEGYVNATANNKGGTNYQGAINLPLIEEKLALRLAGVVDENEVDGVTSVFHDVDPDSDVQGFRATLGFAPTDNFDGQLMHQRISKDLVTNPQYAGLNTSMAHHSGIGRIDPEDRKSVFGSPNKVETDLEVTTLNLNWLVGGFELTYVGQYSEYQNDANSPYDKANWINDSNGGEFSLGPMGTAVNRDEWFQNLDLYQQQESHEIRITPEEPIADFFSYTVGLFYQEKYGRNLLDSNTILSADLNPQLGALNPTANGGAYILTNYIDRPSESDELSAFFNTTFYLTDATELSAGVRQIRSHIWNTTYVNGSEVSGAKIKGDDNELIWNVSLSHRFNDDLMVYGNVGTAVRPGPVGALGVNNLSTPDANMAKVVADRDNERSISYEVGFKLDFLDGRGRLNAAYFYQDFENYIYYSPTTQYFGTNGIESFNFTSNADAVVQGVDLDATYQLLENWNVAAVFSWNESELQSAVPCNDGNLDGRPDQVDPSVSGSLNAGHQIAFCDTGDSASSAPNWSASLRSEYFTEVSGDMEAYVRGIYSYYPENDNKHRYTTIDSYGLLNVFFGVRDIAGAWDLQLFAKNVTDEVETLSYEDVMEGAGGTLANYVGDSGYYAVQLTPRREVGISVRYNFGM